MDKNSHDISGLFPGERLVLIRVNGWTPLEGNARAFPFSYLFSSDQSEPSIEFPSITGLSLNAARPRSIPFASMLLCLITLLSFFAPPAMALDPAKLLTQYLLQDFRIPNSPPRNVLTSLIQTRDGYLWCGSANGIYRFDGVNFVNFNKQNTPDLKSDSVNCMLQAKDGTLWIGTQGGGLVSYSNGEFKIFDENSKLAAKTVFALFEDRQQNLWIGTDGMGLVRLKNRDFQHFTIAQNLSDDHVASICQDRDGVIWAGTTKGLNALSEGKITQFGTKEGLRDTNIERLAVVQDVLWIGTERGGLHSLRHNIIKPFDEGTLLPNDHIHALFADVHDVLWVESGHGRVRAIQDGKSRAFPITHPLWNEEILTITEDLEGNIWLGSRRGQLFQLRDPIFTVFGRIEGLSVENVRTIFEDHEGTIWIGTDEGGLNAVRNGSVKVYQKSEGLSDNSVLALCESSDGVLWAGTRSGISRLQYHQVLRDEILPGQEIRALLCAGDGTIWVGTRTNGLYHFANGTVTNYGLNDGLPRLEVRAFYEAPGGEFWIALEKGNPVLFHNGKFTEQAFGENLINSRSFYQDRSGAFWIGSLGGGLTRHGEGSFCSITTAEGLPSDNIFQIFADRRENLWLSSDKGVIYLSRRELNLFVTHSQHRVHPKLYGEAEGMRNAECNGGSQPSGCADRAGQLWFPTKQGAAMLPVNHLNPSSASPLVLIERINLDRKPMAHIPTGPSRFPAGIRDFEFQYTGIWLTAPERVRFRSRLDGNDKDWSPPTAARNAVYTNLRPGKYNFKVTASNGDGTWSGTPATIAFEIAPFFYQTYSFYFLTGSLLLGAGWAAYQWRIRQLRRFENYLKAQIGERTQKLIAEIAERKRAERALRLLPQRILAAQETERKRVSRELHDSVTQMLFSLRFRLHGLETSLPSEPLKRESGRIKDSIDKTLDEVRRIARNLRPNELDELGLVSAIRSACEEFQERTGLAIECDFSDFENRLASEISVVLYRIFQETLNNIEKHAQATRVEVRLAVEDSFITLEIKDNGKGFVVTHDPLSKLRGRGLGLLNMRERAAFVGGQFKIDSAPGRGTEVVAHLPCKPSGSEESETK